MDKLYEKILRRLGSQKIVNSREVVSAKFVEDSVRYTMEQYNNALKNHKCPQKILSLNIKK
mgnify:CR=1 FL=1